MYIRLTSILSNASLLIAFFRCIRSCHAFQVRDHQVRRIGATLLFSISPERVSEASQTLADWDRKSSGQNPILLSESEDLESARFLEKLPDAVRALNQKATEERTSDEASSSGRCMLGICASTTQEGVATLKSWVSNLDLPRGLLHGMDKDGVPLEFDGPVYIKYNSGGVYTFSDIRKSQMGFDSLWKPGDAMLEQYDGNFRGVYFQVELADGEFRQYLVPLDLFGGL